VLPSRIVTVDYHTGGEPFRIVAEPPVAIPGATVAERRARAIEDAGVQALRGGDDEGQVHQRNVTILADGEVDRSPCGSGTCARLAALADEGRLPDVTVLRHESIVGSTFTGRVLDIVDVDGRTAVVPQVTGMAYRTGEHVFSIDPHDPLIPGFVLR
jgi:proline racemase